MWQFRLTKVDHTTLLVFFLIKTSILIYCDTAGQMHGGLFGIDCNATQVSFSYSETFRKGWA